MELFFAIKGKEEKKNNNKKHSTKKNTPSHNLLFIAGKLCALVMIKSEKKSVVREWKKKYAKVYPGEAMICDNKNTNYFHMIKYTVI